MCQCSVQCLKRFLRVPPLNSLVSVAIWRLVFLFTCAVMQIPSCSSNVNVVWIRYGPGAQGSVKPTDPGRNIPADKIWIKRRNAFPSGNDSPVGFDSTLLTDFWTESIKISLKTVFLSCQKSFLWWESKSIIHGVSAFSGGYRSRIFFIILTKILTVLSYIGFQTNSANQRRAV